MASVLWNHLAFIQGKEPDLNVEEEGVEEHEIETEAANDDIQIEVFRDIQETSSQKKSKDQRKILGRQS